MTYASDRVSEQNKTIYAAREPKAKAESADETPSYFLVNIINRRELVLLEELLAKNGVTYFVRNASSKNRRSATRFSSLGKDVFVGGDHYDRAKATLADYYLGAEQATAETNIVPAARRRQVRASKAGHYPIKRLIMWLAVATVGYTLLFTIWMNLMK